MLTDLLIRDFAIIPRLELQFEKGLTVFTGETGAGKSIILDALAVVLGGKTEAGMIRKDADKATIEAVFKLDSATQATLNPILTAEDLFDEPGFITLSREIRSEGRSTARVNGHSVSASLQAEIGELLVDLHGQSEHLSLLKVRTHIGLLDRFAHDQKEIEDYQSNYAEYTETRHKLENLKLLQKSAAQRLDLLQYQIQEIETAHLKPGEEEELRAERTRLANAETLSKLSSAALAALDEGEQGPSSVTDLLGLASHNLNELAHIDPNLQPVSERTESALTTLSEIAYELRNYIESIEFNPKRLDQIEERLTLISTLKRKYGPNLTDVFSYLDKIKDELFQVDNSEEHIAHLSKLLAQLSNSLEVKASKLSKIRKEAAGRLSQEIERALDMLQMRKARFRVSFDQAIEDRLLESSAVDATPVSRKFGPEGTDRVEFLIETNPGEGFKPLAKIASGGETSRLMLALKTALAGADQIATLVFDEIDQGIGGRVGLTVGEMLWQLARQHQVLCVTHLPQLAAFGDQHFSVEKAEQNGRTSTTVQALSMEHRRKELAAMVGKISEATLNSADDLLRSVSQITGKI